MTAFTRIQDLATDDRSRLLGYWLPSLERERLFADMDGWGYDFRLGSARARFKADAEDARIWLLTHGRIDTDDRRS